MAVNRLLGMSAHGGGPDQQTGNGAASNLVSKCRVGPGNFTPSPSQIPGVNLSIHPARVTARRLPPSAEPSGSSRFYPVGPSSTAMTCPLRSTSVTLASTLLRGSPPLSGASVLSASRLEPLAPFPLASPARFSRSIQEPDRASRCLHAGCRSVSIRTSSELVPEDGSAPGFDTT